MKARIRTLRSLVTSVLALVALTPGFGAAANAEGSSLTPTFRANDYASGHVLAVLPPGEDGLVNASELLQAEAPGGAPPAHSGDQTPPYQTLLYGAASLDDAGLSAYFHDESFGVRSQDVTRVERPDPSIPVTIYRDRLDIPHIYGDTRQAMAFGAGYAAAEDRLFLMDVTRHLGAGRLSEFVGPACSNERMDQAQVLFAGYTSADIDAMTSEKAAEQFGPLGVEAREMALAEVAGINKYIADATQDPRDKLPADYAAIQQTPQPWALKDLVDLGTVIIQANGIGGGGEVANAALLQYLRRVLGPSDGLTAFNDFKDPADPDTPKTIVDRGFPYAVDGANAPTSLNAIPDNAAAPLTGAPTATTAGCDPPSSPLGRYSAQIMARIFTTRARDSNELVVAASRSASGHPVAVFGPQVGYFAPEVLMAEDLHAPDFDAAGASFPGTNDIVELGRGRNFAWSATAAGTDIIDQRLERAFSDPGCRATAWPPESNHYYLFRGQCRAMQFIPDSYVALPRGGSIGSAPARIDHDHYRTVHGVVQGWTTAEGGKPVAVVNQRSTYLHDTESVIGLLRWNRPSYTHDAASWLDGARAMNDNTFNWMYVDDHDIAYYSAGLDPLRNPNSDYALPTWGTGEAEWQGFLGDSGHPQEINPGLGYFVNWNNTQAPEFAQADNDYSRLPVYRSRMLSDNLDQQLALHRGKLVRADVVRAMESAASTDMTAAYLLPELLPYMEAPPDPAVAAMRGELSSWLADGAHRHKAHPADQQYEHAAAIAIMDELYPRLVEAIFDPIFGGAGRVSSFDGLPTGYPVLPLEWASTPNGDGAHQGDAYGGGWEGYVWKVLRALRGEPAARPFSPAVMSRLCVGAETSAATRCSAAITQAFRNARAALISANGGSTEASSWTQDTQTQQEGRKSTPPQPVTMPDFDAIQLTSVGIVGQPNMDWQNRPTFQQVVEFPASKSTTASVSLPSAGAPALPNTGTAGGLAGGGSAAALLTLAKLTRRQRTRWPHGRLPTAVIPATSAPTRPRAAVDTDGSPGRRRNPGRSDAAAWQRPRRPRRPRAGRGCVPGRWWSARWRCSRPRGSCRR